MRLLFFFFFLFSCHKTVKYSSIESYIDEKQKIRIAFIDSGIGGLFFAADLMDSLINHENENIANFFRKDVKYIHFGDTKNMPYGTKTRDEIRKFSLDLIEKAAEQDCKIIFIAGNTSDTVVSEKDVDRFAKRGIYLVKIIKESAKQIFNKTQPLKNEKNIMIFGTKRTVLSKEYEKEIGLLAKKYPKIDTTVVGFYFASSKNEENVLEDNSLLTQIALKFINYKDAANDILTHYYEQNLVLLKRFQSVGLFCTHFAYFKKHLEELLKKDNLNIKVFGQGEFFRDKTVNLLKSEINKNVITLYKNDDRENTNPRIKSFLTGDCNIELYTKLMQDFKPNIGVDFYIIED